MADNHDPRRDEDVTPKDPEVEARREFLKKIGAASAAVPAASLLLAANFKAAQAQVAPYGGGTGGSGSGSGCVIT